MPIDLSVIHTTYNRAHYLKAILPRVELNARRTDVNFEFIILDGGSSDNTRKIALEFLDKKVCRCQYLYVGFNKWVNPSLPRNIALRHAEGRIGCTTDADHWFCEDFVTGAYRAFQDNSSEHVSIGMVWDTNESRQLPWIQINQALLSPAAETHTDILELYNTFGIPIREPKSGWIVAYPMWAVHEIGAYDEDFAGANWARDEDIFLLKLQHILKTTTEYHREFAAFHLCHDVSQFGIQRDSTHNHQIFKEKIKNIGVLIEENKKRNWGQIPTGVKFEYKKNW